MRAACVALLVLALTEAAAGGDPFRRIVLPAGDRLFGRIVSIDDQHVVFVGRNGREHKVPRNECVGITQPDGLIDFDLVGADDREPWQTADGPVVWVKDEERGPAVEASPSFAMQATLPDAAVARMAFDWHAPDALRDGVPPVRLLLELSFAGDADGTRLSIAVPLGESRRVTVRPDDRIAKSFEVTERPARAGWREIVLLLHAGRLRVLVDGQIGVAGEAPRTRLMQIGVRTEPVGPAAAGKLTGWKITRPQLQRLDPDADAADLESRDPSVDTVVSAAGDETFGRLTSASPVGLQLTVSERSLSIPWSDVRRLTLATKPDPTPAVVGERARVELAPPADQLPQRPDVLTGTILSESADALTLFHPVLGPVRIPAGDLKKVTRFGHGLFQVLDSTIHHLGDEVRSGFRRPRPEGTALEGSFSAESIPVGRRGWICFEVVDVEPCGPDAPKGTPFLAELRAGGLRTEVMLNGTSLGDLNSHLTYKAAPSGTQRIRIPFKTELLKSGDNVWRLKQRPARNDDSSFDDCEIGPVTLEIDLPERATKTPAPASEASR